MRYRDVAAAVAWLCTAFGFERHRVVAGSDGEILIAQLTFNGTMIMLLPVGGSDLDKLMKQPDEIGGAETQSCYFVVDDADVHYGIAKAAGAKLVLNLKEYDTGGRGYSCRDPEGHIWSFGTYDPWKGKAVAASRPGGKRNSPLTTGAILATTVAIVMAGWMLVALPQSAPSPEEKKLRLQAIAEQQRAEEALQKLAQESSAREAFERAAQQSGELLARGQIAKEAAERTARELEGQLTEERRARDGAERAAGVAGEQATRERIDKEVAERIASDVRKELTLVQAAKQRAERSAQEAGEQLIRERGAKEVAERAAKEAQAQLSQAQSAENGVAEPAKQPTVGQAQSRAVKSVPKKASEPVAAQEMPPVIP